MNYIKKKRTEIKTNNITTTLNKISIYQIIVGGISFLICLLLKKLDLSYGIFIGTLAASIYTQLLRFSYFNKYLALFGFPVRLILIGIPTAILVCKIQANLLGLFAGFIVSQVIYFIFVWKYTKKTTDHRP